MDTGSFHSGDGAVPHRDQENGVQTGDQTTRAVPTVLRWACAGLRWIGKAVGVVILLLLLIEATAEIEAEGGDIRFVGVRMIWIALRLAWWLMAWLWQAVTHAL